MDSVLGGIGLENLGDTFHREKVGNMFSIIINYWYPLVTPNHEPVCLQFQITPAIVSALSDQQLSELGVTTIGDRAALRTACLCHPAYIYMVQNFFMTSQRHLYKVAFLLFMYFVFCTKGHFLQLYESFCTSGLPDHLDEIEQAVDVLDTVISGHDRQHYRVSSLVRLRMCFVSLHERVVLQAGRGSICPVGALCVPECAGNDVGKVGRPRIPINTELVQLLFSAGFNVKEIANAMLVSRVTLWRRLKEDGIGLSRYSDI